MNNPTTLHDQALLVVIRISTAIQTFDIINGVKPYLYTGVHLFNRPTDLNCPPLPSHELILHLFWAPKSVTWF